MARPENAQIEEPAEKVIPITDPETETAGSPGSVTKRPFELDKKRGSGGGNMPLMLMVLAAIIIFGIGMLAFLSSKGTTRKKTAAEAAKPDLGRVTGTTAPGDLVPSDKVKPSPEEAKPGGCRRRSRHQERRPRRRRSLRRKTPIKRALLTAASSSTRWESLKSPIQRQAGSRSGRRRRISVAKANSKRSRRKRTR